MTPRALCARGVMHWRYRIMSSAAAARALRGASESQPCHHQIHAGRSRFAAAPRISPPLGPGP